jgi:hypothetical protein
MASITTSSINDDSSSIKKTEVPKHSPINKYSIHEMKAAIDNQIIEFLENNGFVEHHRFTNLKILTGTFCIFWTAVAYLYPKPFPENFNLVLLSLILYGIGSAVYYYLEKYVVKQSFYTGSNENYYSKLRYGKKEKLKCVRLSSEIKDYSHIYDLWFEFITLDGRKIQSQKVEVDCTKLCDEMGHVNSDLVFQQFKTILDDQLAHKLI